MNSLRGFYNLNPISLKAKLIGGGMFMLLVAGLLAYAGLVLYNSGKKQANHKITEYEQKIDRLNSELARKEIVVRERVITNYHTKEIIRTKTEYKNNDIIRNLVPEQFNLSEGWIHSHNQLVEGKEISPTLASNTKASKTSDKEALEVIATNYNIANKNTDQLETLQNYLREVGLAE